MKKIPELAALILISGVVVVGSLATVAWVIAAGQGLSLDTIFLVLSALAVALVFALYAMMEIGRIKAESQKQKPASKTPAPSEG